MSTTAHFSLAEYDRLVLTGALDSRRLELIHGEIREMSPIGPIHENVVDLVAEWSFANVGNDTRIRIQHSIGLVNLDSAPEPDIVWVTKRDYSSARPTAADVLLVVEVSDTSLSYDLGEKASLYAAERIAEYWVIDVASKEVVVHREPSDGRYAAAQRLGVGAAVQPLSRSASLDVASLFPAS